MRDLSSRSVSNEPLFLGMNQRKLTQLFVAGFCASVAMVVLSFLLGFVRIPAPDYGGLYGSILNGGNYPSFGSGVWWAGMFWHLANGTFIFPLAFGLLVDRALLTQQRWMKGALWAVAIWLVVEAIMAPIAGLGFFLRLTLTPAALVTTDLLCWLAYGLVLDGMTRVRVVHEIEMRKAA